MRSTACRRPWRCSSSAARRPRARPSAASRRSRTCCACSIRAPATIRRASRILYAESFSPNTPEGACPTCHGLGRIYDVTEAVDGARRFADHPRARHRRLAAGVARAEPARHRHHAGLRHRQALARAAQEGSRLAPVHRRAAARCRSTPGWDRDEVRRGDQAQGRRPATWARSPARAEYVLQTFATTQSAADEEARRRSTWSAAECPVVPRQAAAARSAVA